MLIRPSAWEADALPTELLPLIRCKFINISMKKQLLKLIFAKGGF